MAEVHVKDGYTRIADALLEALARTSMPVRHLRTMLAIVRLTYGYGKRERRMGSKLLEKVTGIDDGQTRRCLRDLEAWGVITRADGCPGRASVIAASAPISFTSAHRSWGLNGLLTAHSRPPLS